MSGDINIKFNKLKEYNNFSNLWKDKRDYCILRYTTNNPLLKGWAFENTFTYINFYNYLKQDNIINLEYPLGIHHGVLAYFFAYEISKRYSIQINGGCMSNDDFFSNIDDIYAYCPTLKGFHDMGRNFYSSEIDSAILNLIQEIKEFCNDIFKEKLGE